MFRRELEPILLKRAQKIPVIAILGPRQSGKTTLAKGVFSQHKYVSLENHDDRELATNDPRGFLDLHKNIFGIILDEIQHAPKLLSYIQTYVDEAHRPGHIILTGSQNILLNAAISQTLAGRIAIFTLLPFSINELKSNGLLGDRVEDLAYKGGYPRIYTYDLEPTSWYADYIETYVERDVRQIAQVADLSTFKRFIRLCAGQVGQLLNFVSLANDCGIDQRTAKAWLSILEASYIVFLLQPHHVNFRKRLIKSPKLYFYDSGLVCALLDIKSSSQLDTHYLRGGIVESLLISEIIKYYYNRGERPHHVYFWRNQTGNELDCVIQKNNQLVPIEIKAGQTVNSSFFTGLNYWATLAQTPKPNGYVLYGGNTNQTWPQGKVVSWKNLANIFEDDY